MVRNAKTHTCSNQTQPTVRVCKDLYRYLVVTNHIVFVMTYIFSFPFELIVFLNGI